MSAYRGEPGGPSDPATPGGYCLAICRCGTCPQYAEQERRATAQREAEYGARRRHEIEGRHRRRARVTTDRRSAAALDPAAGPAPAHDQEAASA